MDQNADISSECVGDWIVTIVTRASVKKHVAEDAEDAEAEAEDAEDDAEPVTVVCTLILLSI